MEDGSKTPEQQPSFQPAKDQVDEKNALADATNPVLLPSPPPLRVSPPPSYSSGSFRRCDNKQPSKCVYCGNGAAARAGYWDPRTQALLHRSNQSMRALGLLGFALLFLVVFALLMYGNQYLFRQRPFNGWCGTSYVEEGRPRQLAQEMEIDPEQFYEKIQVPKFGMNRPAVFVHDFRKNITAIVDVLGDRCFLKALDRSVVVPPKNFIDLIQKMENGYYAQNPRVIHETFRVGMRLSSPELLALDSAIVSRHCANKDVFQLVRASRAIDSPYFVRDKRDAATPDGAPEGELQFSVLSGENVEVERIVL